MSEGRSVKLSYGEIPPPSFDRPLPFNAVTISRPLLYTLEKVLTGKRGYVDYDPGRDEVVCVLKVDSGDEVACPDLVEVSEVWAALSTEDVS